MSASKYDTAFLESELILAASADDDDYIEEMLRSPDNFADDRSLGVFMRIVDNLSIAVYEERQRRKREP